MPEPVVTVEAQQPGSIPWVTEPGADLAPLSEWDRSQAIMSLAFPSLFPTGEGDYVQPREREISYSDYVLHLMRYSNGRFASHSRFPYFVFNTWMRQQSSQLSSFFVNRFNRPEGRDVSIEDISATLAADSGDYHAQALLNSVVRSAASLRGTRPFWNGKKHQLMAYIRALGKPSLFMTLSAADLQWDALARSMPDYDLWKQASGKDRIRIATKNLRLNPHIAATHFERRFNHFLHSVLIPKFNVKDYWMRIEFQGRGSSHSHFFLWCEGPPPFDVESPAGRDQFAELWHRHVRGVNPEPERTTGLYDTSALQSDNLELKNTMANFSDIVNRVQPHRCSPYCQRRKKGAAGDEEYCRFYFPRLHRERGVVSKEHNPNQWSFIAATNDSQMNPYNRLVSMAWRANTDVSPCTSMHAVMTYIAKYASKEEKATTPYRDIMRRVIPRVSSEKPFLSFVARMLNQLIQERDWSSQEVAHLLQGLPLAKGSRTQLSLDCRPKNQQQTSVMLDEGAEEGMRKGQSLYDKYEHRAPRFEDVSLFEYITRHNLTRPSRVCLIPNDRDWRVINYFPRYQANGQDPSQFYRVKIILHHPFRDYPVCSDADRFRFEEDGPEFKTWQEAFVYCKSRHNHPDDYYEDPPQPVNNDDEFEERPEEPVAGQAANFQDLLNPQPNALQNEDPDRLGDRELDREANWRPRIGKYADQYPLLFTEGPQWWDNRKEAAPAGFDVATQSTSQSDNLNWQQRQLYDTVLQHYGQHLAFERGEGPAPRQLLINVDGSAGTGKSYVIKLISAHLQAAARNYGLASPVMRLAPTGSAAFNIEGSTIHTALKIPVGSKFGAPTDAQRTGLQNTFRPIRYIVIDEKSMVSLQLMGQIDQRLRSAAFERPDAAKYFGGMNILLCGDFYQLTPVAATPLFTPEPKKLEDISGRSAYCAFDTTVTLSTIVRQQGGDQEAFRQALEALRHGTVEKAHWDTLMTRTKYKLTPGEIDSFRDAVHLFFANKFVKEHNHDRLRDMGSPVIAINAEHDTPAAANVDADKFQNLQAVLRVSIGCRVMLLNNLWTEHGLVNGRQGDLVDIVWPVGLDGDPRDSLPLFMLVAFDDLPADAPEVFRNNRKKVVLSGCEFGVGLVVFTRYVR